MGPSKAFRDSTCAEFQEDILIQEIWEEGLPNVEEGVVHYFVDHESDEDEFLSTAAAENGHVEEEELENSALFSTFSRLPQASTTRKTNLEPLVGRGKGRAYGPDATLMLHTRFALPRTVLPDGEN